MPRARKRTLQHIVEDMRQSEGLHFDAESTHSRADGLLEEALRLLAQRYPSQREVITALLASYGRVEKWYS